MGSVLNKYKKMCLESSPLLIILDSIHSMPPLRQLEAITLFARISLSFSLSVPLSVSLSSAPLNNKRGGEMSPALRLPTFLSPGDGGGVRTVFKRMTSLVC